MTSSKASVSRATVVAAWACVVVIVVGVVLQAVADFGTHQLPNGVSSPILALELLKDASDLPSIVGTGVPNDRAAMTHVIYVDYGFIPAYAVFLVLIGILEYRRGYRVAGLMVMVLVPIAAGCDVVENQRMLGVLAGMTSVPRDWSMAKWTLIFGAIGLAWRAYLDPTLPIVRRWIGYFAGGLGVLGALLGILGIIVGTDSLLEAGATTVTRSLGAALLFLASSQWLAHGLLNALNRLARSRWLGWLTDWPSDEDISDITGPTGTD